MSTKNLLKIAALMLVMTFSYVKMFAATIIVNSNITANTTWTNNNTYILVGIIYVTNNATLTINKGTWVQGDDVTLGSLVITRGAKLNAIGTACEPIVFTSEKPAGTRNRGDWGGIILLGYAELNTPGDTGHIEGITPNPNTLYGGGANPNCGGGDCPDNNDNSGTLQYMRIEFPGIALAPNNEINGLTMGGVGSGTTINHVEVSYGNDDAFEWFGGNVNCKYLIAYSTLDDDFDTDFGYSGKVQFAFSMRDPAVADVSGSQSFESDNDASGSTNTPKTSVVFNNVTALSGASITTSVNMKRSAHLRRNTQAKIYNSIMMGMPQGILIDGSLTIANCAASSLVASSYVHQNSGSYRSYTPSGDPNEAAAEANLAGSGNVYSTTYTGVLVDPNFPITDVDNLAPAVGNPLPSSNTALYSGGFWTSVSYVGAFNPAGDSWAGDWSNFDPINTVYTTKINYTPKVSTTLITNVICPNSGAVDIAVTDGVSPYTYVWSNGATTQDLTGVAKGTYTVTVFDAGRGCAAAPKKNKVGTTLPILTSCSATSTSITVNWANNIAGAVTGYQLRNKKHSVSTYGPWINVGNGTSFTTTGLLANTQYDFQLRGTCTSGNTGKSATLLCSTTARLASDQASDAAMSVFPNPSNGNFKISLDGFADGTEVTVKVTDVLGKVVYTLANVPVDENLDMSLGNLPSGMYNVSVSDESNQFAQKIMLNK